MSKGSRVVIHRGAIPGTDIGHHWLDARDGNRYGITGGPGPDGGNKGWAYEIVDPAGRHVDDSMFRLDDIREWAQWSDPVPSIRDAQIDGLHRPANAPADSDDDWRICQTCGTDLYDLTICPDAPIASCGCPQYAANDGDHFVCGGE